MGGKLLYKCRLCGAVDSNTYVPDIQLAILCILNGYPKPEQWVGMLPSASSTHLCEDGKTGVADLIGGEAT